MQQSKAAVMFYCTQSKTVKALETLTDFLYTLASKTTSAVA